MTGKFWIKHGELVDGPFTSQQIVGFVRGAMLKPTDLISADNKSTWKPASEIPGLFPSAPASSAETVAPAVPTNAPEVLPATKKSRRPLVVGIVLAAAAIALAIWAITWFFSSSAAVDRALAYAPPNAGGIVHVAVAEIAQDVADELRKQKYTVDPKALDDFTAIARKIESIDLFFTIVSKHGVPGKPLVVVRGRLARADVERLLAAASPDATLEKGGNGRYALTGKNASPLSLVLGSEADDLPDDVNVAAPEIEITPEFLKTLGKGDNKNLRAMLKSVDASAPIWFAVNLEAIPSEDVPKSFTGSIHLFGTGRTQITADFRADEQAKEFEERFRGSEIVTGLSDIVLVKREETTVTVATKSTESIFGRLLTALERARTLARRISSAANLNGIGKAIMLYKADNDDQPPPDLETLVKENIIGPKTLISPTSGREMPVDEHGMPTAKSDYVYFVLPDSAPANLIWVYEPPEINDNEGANVLYCGYNVAWVSVEEFREQLQRTKDWLAENKPK